MIAHRLTWAEEMRDGRSCVGEGVSIHVADAGQQRSGYGPLETTHAGARTATSKTRRPGGGTRSLLREMEAQINAGGRPGWTRTWAERRRRRRAVRSGRRSIFGAGPDRVRPLRSCSAGLPRNVLRRRLSSAWWPLLSTTMPVPAQTRHSPPPSAPGSSSARLRGCPAVRQKRPTRLGGAFQR